MFVYYDRQDCPYCGRVQIFVANHWSVKVEAEKATWDGEYVIHTASHINERVSQVMMEVLAWMLCR